MPPIRWLFLAVLAINTSHWIKIVSADRPDLPVASNGWRPIVGERYESASQNVQPQTKQNNNNQHMTENAKFNRNQEQKVLTQANHNHFNKNGAHIRVNHHGSSGHHNKLNMPNKLLQKPTTHPNVMANKMAVLRHPSANKGHQNQHLGAKRHKVKPQRPAQLTAHSSREELIAPAPSSAIGSYAYFNPGPFNVRDTQIGDRSKYPFPSPYNLQASNAEVLAHLIPSHYTFPKHPNQNDLHKVQYSQYYNQNDEFTRNLVPPPPLKPQDKEVKEGEKLLTNPQFVLNQMREESRPYAENIVLQLPAPYSFVNSEPIDLEITKERFREYHTTASPVFSKGTTENYSTFRYTRPKEYNNMKHYEVTEDKTWQENSPFFRAFSTPYMQQGLSTSSPENDYRETTQFLPTPFLPENAYPTSPTQAEVSTIYSQLSRFNQRPSYTQSNFQVKDVATHYPIYDLPKPEEQHLPVQSPPQVNEYVDEATTKRYEVHTDPPTTRKNIESEFTEQFLQPTQQTLPPTRPTRLPQRNRVAVRRRRPTRPSTTTEAPEVDTEGVGTTSERPRRRRPGKYRTTEASAEYNLEATTRASIRRNPSRPSTTTEEASENYPANFPRGDFGGFGKQNYAVQEVEEAVTEGFEAHYMRPKEEKKLEEAGNSHNMEELTTEEYRTTVNSYTEESEPESTTLRKRFKLRPSTTDVTSNTNIKTPENELDYTTSTPQTEQPITVREIYQVYQEPEPEVTTILSTTTTTTTEGPTTKTNRLRRPVKYDTHRPRFSVKDYRQRLTQYTSTTESGRSQENIGKIKYPSRFTKSEEREEVTESYRQKFKPKDPRHRLITTERAFTESTTEKTKPSKLRPFMRSRSTESSILSTTTPKISIKPNIFSNLKRPQPVSLRNRIYNKNKGLSTTTEAAVEVTESEMSTEQAEVTISAAENKIDTTTESFRMILEKENIVTQEPEIEQHDQEQEPDDEAFLQLQRISELTSSSKNHFKTMSSTSRRVPNYFTISTDDPILPIEAFFPKLSQRNSE